ncbi:MAG: phosphoglycerate kinase [Deltaproteobacteria bacterium RIFCSPLOWO2_02_FULL_44_10]|nr:MAG: phosphoglycerate kinase [Deltaproteobacteria bacterium RIFCSPHIGHO2_02_FULL_44_16]OGQ47230.1 MAG: phosphoglycerate kinase [Deltaproteobacteria bacterium RIFCSPLOWO2_02_FULL_44_10]
MIKYIDEIPIHEKRVFIRVDFNVPVKNDVVTDDSRIQASLPTIRYALGQKARIVLASHRGRPKGKPNAEYSLKPVGQHLSELLGDVDVLLPESCVGQAAKKLIREMAPGQIVLLENLRFHPGEETNDPHFAAELAQQIEVYMNDAFGTAHRAHASTVGMVSLVPEKGAGFLMRREITYLTEMLKNPRRPFISLLGGAKVSDKLGVIENLFGKVDHFLIGGAMAYTFLKAKGYSTGTSLLDETKLHSAKRILERAATRQIPFLLPVDHVIAKECSENVIVSITEGVDIPEGMMALDIGPKTRALFLEALKGSKTIFWNGPMGVFEFDPFSQGTLRLAEGVAASGAISIVGGGDSIAAIKKSGVESRISHLSTGGGASLEFVEGKKLPGLGALEV